MDWGSVETGSPGKGIEAQKVLREARCCGVDQCIGRLCCTCRLSLLSFRRINCKVVGCLLSTSPMLLMNGSGLGVDLPLESNVLECSEPRETDLRLCPGLFGEAKLRDVRP